MKALGERRALYVDAIAQHHIEQLAKNPGVFFNELRPSWQRYLARETPWRWIGIKVCADSNQSWPLFKVVNDTVRSRAHPWLQRRTRLPRSTNRVVERFKLARAAQSRRHVIG
ncbi:MAG: hypothetical protein ABS36_12735 [Acidobacteria bacterium SCN 69-37]|nr:MAG: hypothetical protein ABS36_12735 [Acidobacteria bacterium SCN 69-37]